MKNRCYISPPNKIIPAIYSFNLSQDTGGSSGSIESIEEGISVIGGYLVKQKGEILGWGAALKNRDFCIYVRPFARKFGIASKIIKRAKKDFPRHVFCPWNLSTLTFFKNRRAAITKEYIPYYLCKNF